MSYINKLDLILESPYGLAYTASRKMDAATVFQNQQLEIHFKELYEWVQTLDVESQNDKYRPGHTMPSQNDIVLNFPIDWDPQSDQLLDDGDEWGSDEGDIHIRFFKGMRFRNSKGSIMSDKERIDTNHLDIGGFIKVYGRDESKVFKLEDVQTGLDKEFILDLVKAR